MKGSLLIFLLAHILGDYYFQWESMAEKKDDAYRRVMGHSLLYAIPFLMMPLFVETNDYAIWFAVIFLGVTHFLIDSIKYGLKKYLRSSKGILVGVESKIYLFDQLLHMVCLLTAAYFYTKSGNLVSPKEWLSGVLDVMDVSGRGILNWVLTLLLIWHPTNITIKKPVASYRPLKRFISCSPKVGAGANIGTLERMSILLLLSVQQYSAIGLVLTAKSITRFKKLSDERFAEYYLLGTLLSTIIAILTYLLIF